MKYYIYKLIAPNGRCYIGQTNNIIKRFSQYRLLYTNTQPKLHRSLLKYGWENFNKEVLIETTEEFSDFYECLFIKFYNTFNNGLNCDGGGSATHVLSEETKKKIGKANKGNKAFLGKKHSEETKRKISISKKGKKFSTETKLKIGLASKGRCPMLGKKHTKETRLKMSKSQKGRIVSEETKKKMSISFAGRTHSYEAKQKMKIAALKYWNKA